MGSAAKIVIDARERELIKQFQGDHVEVRMLELGDALIEADEGVMFVLERKTYDDLYASVKDGRYQNQKTRLMATYDVKKVVYVIEGRVDEMAFATTMSNPQTKICLGCIYNMTFRDHLKIVRTRDLGDTAAFIQGLYDRIKEDPNKYRLVDNNGGDTSGGGHEHIVKLGAVSCPLDFFVKSLCQLPGVSHKTAVSIGKRFGSTAGLIHQMSDKTVDERKKMLKEITTQDERGNSRKISIRAVQSVINYLVEPM